MSVIETPVFDGPAVPIVGQRTLHLQAAFAQAVCRCDCGGAVMLPAVMVPSPCRGCGTVYALKGLRIGPQPDGTVGCQIEFSVARPPRVEEH